MSIAHLPAAIRSMAAGSIQVNDNANNVATQRASFAASNAAGQTHSYQALYHPQTGVLQVARDGVTLGSWTDTTPLVSGGFLSLRTDGSTVQFDDIAVSEVIKYYYIGGQRVATRRGGTLYYLHSDHLGSTSVASNSAGAEVTNSRVQYYPYGGTRSGGSGLPTEYRYTGQRREPSIGLYDYGARFYEPRIGRFLSPDPIVPQPGDPQSLNRYAYVRNNPLRFIDPTGYAQACAESDEGGGCGRGATYEEIYKYFLQAGSTLYEYYALLAKLNRALGAGASEAELADLQGSVEAAYQRGSYWVPQASFDPWMAAVDPGSAYRFGAAVTPTAAQVLTRFVGKIYRSASGTPDSVTPRPGIDDVPDGGLSFFDSLENPGVKPGKYSTFALT